MNQFIHQRQFRIQNRIIFLDSISMRNHKINHSIKFIQFYFNKDYFTLKFKNQFINPYKLRIHGRTILLGLMKDS